MTRISKLLVTKDNLNLIKTNKYKDINIVVRLAFKYERKLKASLMLLSSLMQEECEKYPSKVKMNQAKDMLYGLYFGCYVNNVSDVIYYSINYNFANPKFLKDVKESDYIAFIDETLNRPLFTESLFIEERRNLIDSLKRKLDKPNVLATNLFYKEVIKDDPRFASYDDDVIDELEKLTLADVKEAYTKLFTSRVDIYLVGDYSCELESYLTKYKSNNDIHCDVSPLNLTPKNEITFQKQVSQSSLIVSYIAPYTKNSKDFYAFNLGTVLFGGTPVSLLFSEVREKSSLCYSIFARSMKYEGLVWVSTNIDGKTKKQTLDAVRKQFKRIVEKDYDPAILEMSKSMFINNSLTIDDDLDYLIDYHYAGIISDTYVTIDDYAKEIEKVTVDDVARVYQNFEEYLVYFLEGIKNE